MLKKNRNYKKKFEKVVVLSFPVTIEKLQQQKNSDNELYS